MVKVRVSYHPFVYELLEMHSQTEQKIICRSLPPSQNLNHWGDSLRATNKMKHVVMKKYFVDLKWIISLFINKLWLKISTCIKHL